MAVHGIPAKPIQAVVHCIKQSMPKVNWSTFQKSWEKCLALLVLSHEEHPSDVHRQLVSWLQSENNLDRSFLHATFLSKMPVVQKKMLLSCPDLLLQELVTLADIRVDIYIYMYTENALI